MFMAVLQQVEKGGTRNTWPWWRVELGGGNPFRNQAVWTKEKNMAKHLG